MGLSHSPRIVTDGLILCLDAANKKSYPGSGSTWTDLSYNKKTATFINMAADSFVNLKGGQINLDGTNDYIAGNSTIGLSGDPDFSISHWLYWNHDSWNGNYPSGFGNSTAWSNSNWLGTTFHGGRIAIDYWVNRFRASASSVLDVRTWYHVGFTKVSGSNNATNTRLYINGENVSGATENGTTVNITDSNFRIGLTDTHSYFRRWPGYINCISVYNRVLTPDEMKNNYNATKWRFK